MTLQTSGPIGFLDPPIQIGAKAIARTLCDGLDDASLQDVSRQIEFEISYLEQQLDPLKDLRNALRTRE